VVVAFVSAGGIREAAGLVRHVGTRWLMLAAACQVGQFAALTMHVRCLAGPATNTRRVGPARRALVVFGLGPVVAAAPGEWVAVAVDRLRWWRKPRPSHAESRERGAAWHAAAAHVVSGPRGMVVLGATAVAAWMADAMCLYVALLAFDVQVSLVVLLFAY